MLPRKLTGSVPVRCSSNALEPLGKARKCGQDWCRNKWQLDRHTVDIGARRKGGISRDGLGDIVVGSVHVMVFLEVNCSQQAVCHT